MPDKIRVGLITHAGGAHLSAYFDALAQTDEVESVALCDASEQSVEAARKTLKDKLTGVFQEPAKMLREAAPRMALVSMEAASSPPAIEAALDAGCHVFAEKPACVYPQDFARLAAKADGKHLLLMLALANRINPPIAAARKLIETGQIGKIYGVEMHLIADQTRLKSPSYHKTWFAQKARAGGGNLAWLGIHWLDLAMFLTGSSVNEVVCFRGVVGGQPIDVEDSAAVALRFDNGTFGTLTTGYYLDSGYHQHVKIWGSQGWLQLEPRGESQLVWQSTKNPAMREVQRYTGPTTPSGYTPFVRAAVRAAAGLAEPPISTADSLRAVRLLYACYRAADTGQKQSAMG